MASGASQSSTPAAQHKRHWGNYLLDRKLQLRYAITVAALSAVISAALGYLIYRQSHLASAAVLSTFDGLEQNAAWAEVRRQAAQRLAESDNDLVLQMFGIGIGLVLVLSLYLVILTHKVAGPLFKMSTYFDKMAVGRFDEVSPPRHGDMLIDFYAEFQDTHKMLRRRFQEDVEAMSRFLAACDQAGVKRDGALGQELTELEQHIKQRSQSLR